MSGSPAEQRPGVQLPRAFIWDLETYPNFFLFCCQQGDWCWSYEISEWTDERAAILQLIDHIRAVGGWMVGFNTLFFDYPVLNVLLTNRNCTLAQIYAKAQSLIASFDRFPERCDYVAQQVDLYKLHHFDNKARSTSLKALEVMMGMDSVQDLPIKPGTILTREQADQIKLYCWHDIKATRKFYEASEEALRFRLELGADINANDTKLGKDFFIKELEERTPGTCWVYVGNKRVPRQTPRPVIALKDAILPQVRFSRPELQSVLEQMRSTTLTSIRGSLKCSAIVDGFQLDYGTGGIHGSIATGAVHTDEDGMLLDMDVASFYPNLAIKNRFYPEHLGEPFCDIYEELYQRRKAAPKGSAINGALKLALNGVYGDSGNEYSPFYDPLYTMKITINGQLLLSMLIESLLPHCSLVQANTDGITVKVPWQHTTEVMRLAGEWQRATELELEFAPYRSMWIKDVNNYIALYENGKVKRKGAYEHKLAWHQDPSALVVPKVVEKVLVEGADLDDTLRSWSNTDDFLLRYKGRRSDIIAADGQPVQRIGRYYVSTEGVSLTCTRPATGEGYKRKPKVSDALYRQVLAEVGSEWDPRIHTANKSVYAPTEVGICAGEKVTLCNERKTTDRRNLKIEWYREQCLKLMKF